MNGCWTTESKNIRDGLVGEPVNGSCEVLLEVVVGEVEGLFVCFEATPRAFGPSNRSMAARWNKRKRDDWDDEDTEDERVGTQVLPVARSLPSDGVPRDGAEYLLAVRYATVCHPRSALLTPALYEF